MLSGVVVLDLDGPEGEAEPRKYCHPPNPKVRSAGGLHLYFKQPVHEVKTRISVVSGLDVKASEGYGVATPSIGPNVGAPIPPDHRRSQLLPELNVD
jgi:hypothetical protein